MIDAFASTNWVQAMICIAPLLLLSSASGAGFRVWAHRTGPKVRCWLAAFLASFAAYALHPVQGDMPWLAYIAIDTLAGLAAVASPSGIASRLIGLLFFVMILCEAAAGSAGSDGAGNYQATMLFLGWAMWAILLLWGAHDAWKSLAAYYRGGSSAPHVGAHIAASRQRSAGVIEP